MKVIEFFCHAIINEFGLAGQDASKTSQHIADSLVGISKNMSMDFGAGISEITKGIQVVGTVANQTAKLTSDQTEAMLGSIIEKTRLGGEEVANGMKTVIARIYQSKSVDPSITDDDMSKTSAMLSKLGIAVKDTTTGAFRPLNDILKDVAKSEQGMTDSQKSALNGQAAGIRQLNIFATAVDTVGKTQTLTNDAINSSGELLTANGKYMDTASAKAKVLGATMSAMWQGLISSSSIKDVLGALNSMASGFSTVASNVGLLGVAFGVIVDVIGTKFILAVGKSASAIIANGVAMTAEEVNVRNLTVAKIAEAVATGTMTEAEGVNAVALASMSTAHVGLLAGIKQAILGFLGFDVGIDTTTIALNGLKIAEVVATAGLILIPMAIGMVINAVSGLNAKKQESLDTSAQTIASSKTEYDSNQTLIDQYNTTKANQDGSATAKQKLVDIEEALAKALPETASGYDAENNKISTNIKLVGQVNDAKKQTMIIDAQSIKDSMGSIDSEIANAKKEQDAIDKINANRKAGSDPHYLTTKVGSTTTSVDNWAQEDSQMKTYNDDIKNTNANVDKYNTNSQILNKYDSQTIANKSKINPLVDSNSGAIDKNTKTLTYNINGALENGSAIDKNTDAMLRNTNGAGANNSGINKTTDVTKSSTSAMNDNTAALKAQGSAIGGEKVQTYAEDMDKLNATILTSKTIISSANTIIDQHTKSNEWDMDAILKLAKSYPILYDCLGNDAKMTQALIKIKTDQTNTSVSQLQVQIKANDDLVNALGTAYSIDVKNKNMSEDAKNKSVKDAITKRIGYYQDELDAEMDAESLATSMKVDPKTGAFTYDDKSTSAQKAAMAQTQTYLSNAKADLDKLDVATTTYKQLTTTSTNLGKYLSTAGDSTDNGTTGSATSAADKASAAATKKQTNAEDASNLKVANDQLRVAQATTDASRKKAQERLAIDTATQVAIKQKGETASQLAQDKIAAIQIQTSNAAAATQAKLESDKAKATQKQADLESKAAQKVANDQLKLAEATTAISKRNAQDKLTADLAAEDALKKKGAIAAALADAQITAAQAQTQSITDATNTQTANILATQKSASNAIIAGYQSQIDAINAKSAAEQKVTDQLKVQKDLIQQAKDVTTAENEKNVKTMDAKGNWNWEANSATVQTAKDALTSTQASYKTFQTGNKIDILNALIKTEQDKQAKLTGYAVGTDDAASGVKKINENGIELVIGNEAQFKGGEKVIPAPQTASILSGESSLSSNSTSTTPSNISVTPVSNSTSDTSSTNDTSSNIPLSTSTVSDSPPSTADTTFGDTSSATSTLDNLDSPKIKEAVTKLLSDIDNTIKQFVANSPNYAKNADNNIGMSIKSNDVLIKTPVSNLINDIETNIQSFVDMSPSFGKNTDANIGNGITNNKLLTIMPMENIITQLQAGMSAFALSSIADGSGIVTNLGTGITSKNKDIVDIVTKLTKQIIDLFNSGFGIASPSKVNNIAV